VGDFALHALHEPEFSATMPRHRRGAHDDGMNSILIIPGVVIALMLLGCDGNPTDQARRECVRYVFATLGWPEETLPGTSDPEQGAADIRTLYANLKLQERVLLEQEQDPSVTPANRQAIQAQRLAVQRARYTMENWQPCAGSAN
jgi:hypothetical protein